MRHLRDLTHTHSQENPNTGTPHTHGRLQRPSTDTQTRTQTQSHIQIHSLTSDFVLASVHLGARYTLNQVVMSLSIKLKKAPPGRKAPLGMDSLWATLSFADIVASEGVPPVLSSLVRRLFNCGFVCAQVCLLRCRCFGAAERLQISQSEWASLRASVTTYLAQPLGTLVVHYNTPPMPCVSLLPRTIMCRFASCRALCFCRQ